MSTEPTSTPAKPAPAAPPTRGSQIGDGLKTVAKAIWFLISMLIYAVGLVFFSIGKALIKISGWGRPDHPADEVPDSIVPKS